MDQRVTDTRDEITRREDERERDRREFLRASLRVEMAATVLFGVGVILTTLGNVGAC